MHRNAFSAAEAAMAAHEQGKFWEYADKLFANQRNLGHDNYIKWAKELGLDVAKFKKALDTHKFKAAIQNDQKQAQVVNARGTPNLYVNGRQIAGAMPFEVFKKVIDEELKKAKALVAKGTPRGKVYETIIAHGKIFKTLDDTVYNFDITGSPIKGSPKAKVKLYIFSDFQ